MKGAGRAKLLLVGVVALLAVVGAVSSGCAGTSATPEGTGGGTRGTTTEQTTPGPSESASLNSAGGKPPDSTLAHGKKSVTGTLGSYCYDSVCTDAAGILVPPAEETLIVPVGAALLLEYGGEGRTAVEDASAFPFGPEDVESASFGDLLKPNTGAPIVRRLAVTPDGARWRIQPGLAPGEYVIYVLLKIPEGDAYYSFRVAVEPS